MPPEIGVARGQQDRRLSDFDIVPRRAIGDRLRQRRDEVGGRDHPDRGREARDGHGDASAPPDGSQGGIDDTRAVSAGADEHVRQGGVDVEIEGRCQGRVAPPHHTAERLGDDAHAHQGAVERELLLDFGARQDEIQAPARKVFSEALADRSHLEIEAGGFAPDPAEELGQNRELGIVGCREGEAPRRVRRIERRLTAQHAFEFREPE